MCGIRPKHSNISKVGGYYNLCGIEIKIVAMVTDYKIKLIIFLFIHNLKKICSAKVTNGLKILAKSLYVHAMGLYNQLTIICRAGL